MLDDGSEISARAVVAACDPYRALYELAPADAVGQSVRARVCAIPSNVHGAAPAVINLALATTVQLHDRFQRGDGTDLRAAALLLGTEQSTRSSYEAAARGQIAEDPLVWAAVTSACDPSQAPLGQDSLYAYIAATPVEATGGWSSCDPARETGHRQARPLLRRAGHRAGSWFETPDELSARLGVRNGNVFHVDLNLTRVGPMRPAWGLAGGRTPVRGLVLRLGRQRTRSRSVRRTRSPRCQPRQCLPCETRMMRNPMGKSP